MMRLTPASRQYGPGLAETGYRGVDDARIDRFDLRAAEPELVQRARTIGFDEHVRLCRQVLQNLRRFRPLEIEHQAALVAVERQKYALPSPTATSRAMSPFGPSTLITSAPRSASSVPSRGPAMKLASSIAL